MTSPCSNLDFFNEILYFFSIFFSIYVFFKTQVLKKYNIAAKKSKFNRREMPGKSLCVSLPAEKLSLGQFEIFLHRRVFLLSWHSGSSTLVQILPVIRFAWKTVAEMAENRDLGRGPQNVTSSGSLEMVCLSTLI